MIATCKRCDHSEAAHDPTRAFETFGGTNVARKECRVRIPIPSWSDGYKQCECKEFAPPRRFYKRVALIYDDR